MTASIRASAGRLRDRCFTEADVRSLLIGIRDRALSHAVVEIADTVAHPERDQGPSRNHLITCYGQIAKFCKYQSNDKVAFPVDGTCDWWLKHLLLAQVDNFSRSELKQALGKSAKELKKEIKAYFPSDQQFPTTLAKRVDKRFITIVEKMFSIIASHPVPLFSEESLRRDIRYLLNESSVPEEDGLIDDLIVCVCIIFHKSNFSLPYGETGVCEMHVEQRAPEFVKVHGQEYTRPTPHGRILVGATVKAPHGDKNVRTMFPFIETQIQTDRYIDESLIVEGEYGFTHIDLDTELEFNACQDRPVVRIK